MGKQSERRKNSSLFSSRASQSGFTLTEIMVAVGVLGLVILGATSAMSGLFQSQTMMVDRNEANEFAATLNDYFQSDRGCTGGVKGAMFPVGNTAGVNFSIPNFNGLGMAATSGSTSVDLRAGTNITERLRINRFIIRDKGIPPIVLDNDPTTGVIRQYVAQVSVSMENRVGTEWVKLRPRDYEFPVSVDPSRRITACRVTGDMKDACDLIGGRYNRVNGECVPQTQCQVRGAYSTSTCTPSTVGSPRGPSVSCPSGTVNPITRAFSCPRGAVRTQTGYMEQTFNVYCGKKCSQAVLNQVTFYLCMKCS